MKSFPSHKNLFLLALVTILALGVVGGVIGLIYHFTKSGSSGSSRDENQKGDVNSRFEEAKKDLNDFLVKTHTLPDSSDLLLSSYPKIDRKPFDKGSNDDYLLLIREYLNIDSDKNLSYLRSGNLLDKLAPYYQAELEVTKASTQGTFYSSLRTKLISFSLAMIKVHKIRLAFSDKLGNSSLFSKHQSRFVDLLTRPNFPDKLFIDFLKDPPSPQKLSDYFKETKELTEVFLMPFLGFWLEAEKIRLEFTPLINSEIIEKIETLEKGVQACDRWLTLCALLLLPENGDTQAISLLQAAKTVYFDIWNGNGKKFINYCYDNGKNETIDLLNTLYELRGPKSHGYFKYLTKLNKLSHDGEFPGAEKTGFLEINKKMEETNGFSLCGTIQIICFPSI